MSPKTTIKPYRVAAGEGLANVWFKTGRLAVKTGRAETGGGFSQFETDDPRGTATALHVHRNKRAKLPKEDSPLADLLELERAHRLHGPVGAHGHEGGRLHLTVHERERRASRGAVVRVNREFHRQCGGNVLSKNGSASIRFCQAAMPGGTSSVSFVSGLRTVTRPT